MTDLPSLDTFVIINPRFARSVSITRDAGRKDALDGYILTPNGRDMIRRMAVALRGESSTRAWTLTGPFGSGKSSLALLIAQFSCFPATMASASKPGRRLADGTLNSPN